MEETERTTFGWLDLLWLVFLAGLAVLPPIFEIHKQFVLLSIGAFQIFEQRLLKPVPPRRRGAYGVLVKILLATLLVGHTGVVPSTAVTTSSTTCRLFPPRCCSGRGRRCFGRPSPQPRTVRFFFP